ncbi:hypothetical protein GGI43DRAFT_395574 [Trichoderma evansii]
MPYLEVSSQNFATNKSFDATDTWSTTARSGSPPPVLQTDHRIATLSRSAKTTNTSQNNSENKAQDDLLYCVGSQFSIADDSIKNLSI